jgi:hypothetical protein
VTIEWYPFVTFLARGGVIGLNNLILEIYLILENLDLVLLYSKLT